MTCPLPTVKGTSYSFYSEKSSEGLSPGQRLQDSFRPGTEQKGESPPARQRAVNRVRRANGFSSSTLGHNERGDGENALKGIANDKKADGAKLINFYFPSLAKGDCLLPREAGEAPGPGFALPLTCGSLSAVTGTVFPTESWERAQNSALGAARPKASKGNKNEKATRPR